MDHSILFLSKESIENALTTTNSKRFDKIKNNFERECENCDYNTSNYENMYKHKRVKHSDIKHKCTECDYSHAYPTKVKSHHRQVHLGIPRTRLDLCKKKVCKFFGTKNCIELKHFVFSCEQCEFSSKRGYGLKVHIQRIHEGEIPKRKYSSENESFSCDQCEFITKYRCDLKKHMSKKHIEEAVEGNYTDVKKCIIEDCQYKTLFKFELKNHIDTKHEGVVRFRCDFMNCSFGTNQGKRLKEHKGTPHEKKNVFFRALPE